MGDQIWVSLMPGMIERGTILKLDLFTGRVGKRKLTLSLLKIMPGSKIKEHVHAEDSEIYLPLDDEFSLKRITYCAKGGSHSLENKTDTIMHMLSIKLS